MPSLENVQRDLQDFVREKIHLRTALITMLTIELSNIYLKPFLIELCEWLRDRYGRVPNFSSKYENKYWSTLSTIEFTGEYMLLTLSEKYKKYDEVYFMTEVKPCWRDITWHHVF